MRDFLVSGTMPFILVMSVYFLVRFVMYLLPSKSKGTFLFKAQWHFKKPWLIVPTVVLVVVCIDFLRQKHQYHPKNRQAQQTPLQDSF